MGWVMMGIAYVILISLAIVLYTFPKIKIWIKVLLIPLMVWFSVALFYGSSSLKGSPRNTDPPFGSIITGVYIVEESFMSDTPAIYLTVVYPNTYDVAEGKNPMDPRVSFLYFKKGEPVLHKISYDKDIVKRLHEAMKQSSKVGGLMMWNKGGKGKGKKNPYAKDNGIKILNPFEILKKEGAE